MDVSIYCKPLNIQLKLFDNSINNIIMMVAGTNSRYNNKVKANIEMGFTSCL